LRAYSRRAATDVAAAGRQDRSRTPSVQDSTQGRSRRSDPLERNSATLSGIDGHIVRATATAPGGRGELRFQKRRETVSGHGCLDTDAKANHLNAYRITVARSSDSVFHGHTRCRGGRPAPRQPLLKLPSKPRRRPDADQPAPASALARTSDLARSTMRRCRACVSVHLGPATC